jgi:hypothetical protein
VGILFLVFSVFVVLPRHPVRQGRGLEGGPRQGVAVTGALGVEEGEGGEADGRGVGVGHSLPRFERMNP